MPDKEQGLSAESLGYLNYLHGVLTQPHGSWEGFYRAQSPAMNFALRYQLAFPLYALAAMAQHTPAYRAPYVGAMRGAIEKMLDVAVWGYWRAPSGDPAGAMQSGHAAVLLSPHQRVPAGPPSDPIVRDNLQYSGHLSTMLGLYEKVSGDRRFDEPFTLEDPHSGTVYTYTHGEVAGRIHTQMRESGFGGVCCERGMAYVPCNNYALASNTLHDALHGTRYSLYNAGWLKTVERKMVLKGPALRGVFGATYAADLKLAAPLAFNFTDAWGLAFMLPFSRVLVRKLYSRFKRSGVERTGRGRAFIGSSALSEKMEISDVPINTGFGLILARGMGDMGLARALERYALEEFVAGWDGERYLLRAAPRMLHSTALFALAAAVEPGGESFARLFNAPLDPEAPNEPSLVQVSGSTGRVGVCRAAYDHDAHTLHLGLCQVGSPEVLREAQSLATDILLANIHRRPHVEVDGTPVPSDRLAHGDGATLRLRVLVSPLGVTACTIRLL